MKTEPAPLSVLGFPRPLRPSHRGCCGQLVSPFSDRWNKFTRKIPACVLRVTIALTLVFSMVAPPPVAAQSSGLEGHWEGKIDLPGKAQAISADIAKLKKRWDGVIDIPDLNIADKPLQNILLSEAGSVQFEMQLVVMAVTVTVSFKGKLDGEKITGEFLQAGQEFPFVLERKSGTVTALASSPSEGLGRGEPAAKPPPRPVFLSAPAGTRGQLAYVKEEDTHAKRVTRKGKDYALLFGCQHYEKGWRELNNPVSDVQAIADVLERFYGFEKPEVHPNPTKAEILAALRTWRDKDYGPQDQLLIFFAGHGTYDKDGKVGYLVARDSDREKMVKEEDMGTFVEFPKVETMLEDSKCLHIFLVYDTCYSGTALRTRPGSRDGTDPVSRPPIKNVETAIMRLEANTTRRILTSGTDKQLVGDGEPGSNSPFVHNFLLRLKTFGDAGSFLSTDDVVGFVKNYRNPKDAEPRSGPFGRDDGFGDFFFFVKFNLPKN